jgi:hypothetical protein
MAPRLLVLGLALAALAAGASVAPASAEPTTKADQKPPAYPLDSVPRTVAPHGPMLCPKVELVDYKGDAIRFQPAARIFSGFRDRLGKFEGVVKDVALSVYGRAPLRIVNLGTFTCRRMTSHPDWLSEHGLGNAIDVAGFDFGPLPKGAALPEGLPRAFRHPFEIRVQSHWSGKVGHAAIHARFLKSLVRRLIPRRDIFRVLLGPGYPGHKDHFHFDVSTFHLVQVFDEGELMKADPEPRAL